MSPRPWAWVLFPLFSAIACASPAAQPSSSEVAVLRHVDRVTLSSASVPLAGERCKGGGMSCRCRVPGDDTETEPPSEGHKRFEIRLSADGGTATLESVVLGRFQASGPAEACFYVDVPSGRTQDVAFIAKADRRDQGVSPRFRLTEYGPKGPFWYEIMNVDCIGSGGRCDKQGIDTWVARTVSQRKRGRLDPCGSAVVSKLAWETSGAQADRDGGLYPDLTVRFTLEVKKFATQFAPGSTECIPK
jgi:hypothetical protein